MVVVSFGGILFILPCLFISIILLYIFNYYSTTFWFSLPFRVWTW